MGRSVVRRHAGTWLADGPGGGQGEQEGLERDGVGPDADPARRAERAVEEVYGAQGAANRGLADALTGAGFDFKAATSGGPGTMSWAPWASYLSAPSTPERSAKTSIPPT